jgi:hypothetical protein
MAKMQEQPLDENLVQNRDQLLRRSGLLGEQRNAAETAPPRDTAVSRPEELIELYAQNRKECVYKLIHLFFDKNQLVDRFEQIQQHPKTLALNNTPTQKQYEAFAKFLIWAIPSDELPIPNEVLEKILFSPFHLQTAARYFLQACEKVDSQFLLGEKGGPEAYQQALEDMKSHD